eukprot:3680699-Pleurochrysis_carterae.AAC.1
MGGREARARARTREQGMSEDRNTQTTPTRSWSIPCGWQQLRCSAPRSHAFLNVHKPFCPCSQSQQACT